MAVEQTAPCTIVLIHGLWMTPLSWEHWIARYSRRGYEVLAPAWPGLEAPIEELRAEPNRTEDLGIEEILDHYAGIIGDQDPPPIIMGHSFGGAFTEVLLDRGLGAAGVAIDASAFKEIPGLPFANVNGVVMLTPEEFRYAFTDTLDDKASKKVWERYAVPGPCRVMLQGAIASFTPHTPADDDLDRSNRPPLLVIADGADHTVPGHGGGWEEVADYAIDWAEEHALPRR